MSAVDRILQEAIRLPEDQRLTLAHRILAASEPEPTGDVERAWDLEIRERIRRYDEGDLRRRAAGEVFSELDRRLAR